MKALSFVTVLKVMAKFKVFVHAANADARAVTLAPRKTSGLKLWSRLVFQFAKNWMLLLEQKIL